MIPLIGMFLGAHGNLQCAKAGTDARIVVMCAIYRKVCAYGNRYCVVIQFMHTVDIL